MLFVLQKMVWYVLMPPASLLVLMLAGLVVMPRHRRTGMALTGAGMALLYLLSLGHVADAILRPLERDFRPLTAAPAPVDAVVVPGGGSTDMAWLGSRPVPNAETLARLVEGVRLARQLRAPLVLCGGNGEPFATDVRDADAMRMAALEMGMLDGQLLIENVSRNTLENSHAVRKLVSGRRIVLATSAYYMTRARAFFERRGFEVVPAATYHLVQSRKCTLAALIPGASHLARSTTGIAEWMSMAWWNLRGEM